MLAMLAPVMVALPIAIRVVMKINQDIPTYMVPVCDIVAAMGALNLVWIASWRVTVSSTELVFDLRLHRRRVRWSDVRAFETTKDGLLILQTGQRKPTLLSPKLYRHANELRTKIVSYLGEPALVESSRHGPFM